MKDRVCTTHLKGLTNLLMDLHVNLETKDIFCQTHGQLNPPPPYFPTLNPLSANTQTDPDYDNFGVFL
jgi:hypothetical protein